MPMLCLVSPYTPANCQVSVLRVQECRKKLLDGLIEWAMQRHSQLQQNIASMEQTAVALQIKLKVQAYNTAVGCIWVFLQSSIHPSIAQSCTHCHWSAWLAAASIGWFILQSYFT